jgi:NAD dependent epimerase/dehydratase family enzyme
MRQFAREIGAALHRPSWNPFLGTAMRLVLGERVEAVMSSQRVVPKRAEANGYQFRHTDSGEALRSLLSHA